MTLKTFAAAACLSLITATVGHATTFDFFWSADPTADASILKGDDSTLRAVGTMDINVANGASFDADDISNLNIRVTGDSILDLTITRPFFIHGAISADGSSAIMTSDFYITSNDLSFGCYYDQCGDASIFVEDANQTTIVTDYSSAAAALASYKLTAQVSAVPLPTGGLLLLSGLAGVAALKRRKNRTA